MRVGFVVYGGLEERSGGYRYDRKLVEYLRERGDEVKVIALPPRSSLGTAAAAYSRSVRRQLDRSVDVLLQDALCQRVLWRHNDRLTEPDAVVALVHLLQSADSTTPAGWRISGLRPLWRWFERKYLRSVDGAVCPSVATREGVSELSSVPTTVAYPAGRRETPATDRRAVRDRAARDPLEIAFVGNVVPRKGALTLLSTLSGLEGEWRATIVGSLDADPDHARTVRRRVQTHEFESRIDVMGAVSDERLADVLAGADVLAVPSHRESFGMVYLEAMERGTVPVATTVGGPPEFVVDGYNGRLVPPGDSAVLREVLRSLLDDREMLASLGAGAVETAGIHPTWEESMRRVRQFLRSMVEPDVDPPPSVEPIVERRNQEPSDADPDEPEGLEERRW